MIQAFTISEKMHNMLTQQVHVKYSFQLHEGLKEIKETYANIYTANAELNKHMRDWILAALEDYIKHKKHIIESAPRPDQAADLLICINALISFEGKSLETIMQRFMKGFDYFIRILPADTNPSYQSSIANLAQLKLFCVTNLKTQ